MKKSDKKKIYIFFLFKLYINIYLIKKFIIKKMEKNDNLFCSEGSSIFSEDNDMNILIIC